MTNILLQCHKPRCFNTYEYGDGPFCLDHLVQVLGIRPKNDLGDEIDDLRDTVDELQDEMDELEYKIDELKDKIRMLETKRKDNAQYIMCDDNDWAKKLSNSTIQKAIEHVNAK